MATKLPHFGELVDRLRVRIERAHLSSEVASARRTLSAGTLRNVSTGKVVKEKTWEDYGTEFVDALIRSAVFPLQTTDRERLIKAFHAYRCSYEQLNEMLSKVQARTETIYRAVLRLQFLDMGIRYAALCLWTGTEPCRDMPLWAQENGANEFWRVLLENQFPGKTLVGATGKDCASEVKMTEGQMRHCLYDNAYPGADCLKRLLTDASEFAGALQHYCAYEVCRDLAEQFGSQEVACWVRNMVSVGQSLVSFIRRFDDRVPEHQKQNLIWAMFTGGIGDSRVAGLALRFPEALPKDHRCDLLAMARNEPMAAVSQYVEFCLHMGEEKPDGACWEIAFQQFILEFEEFKRTGRFADGRQPTAKLQFVTESRDKRDCEAVFAKITADDPGDAAAHQIYAQELESAGKLEMAWGEYERAAALDPHFQLPLFALADSKSRAGLHDEALAVVERIGKEGVGPGSRSFIQAVVFIRAGKFLDIVPRLAEAYNDGYEPGVCACILAWFYGRFAHQSKEAAKQQKSWEKVARHHGLPIASLIADLKLK